MIQNIKLATIMGIPLYINWTFFGILIILCMGSGWLGVNMFVIIGVSVVLHEFGHVLAAKHLGYPTTSIVLHFFGGAANIQGLSDPKSKKELLIALAGPAVSLILFGLGYIIYRIGFNNQTTLYFVALNAMLGIANMIPAFPLDGGRVLRSLLAMRLKMPTATQFACYVAYIIYFGLFVCGIAYRAPTLMILSILLAIACWAENRNIKRIYAEKLFNQTEAF